jgi:hypothetical protein
VFWGGFEPNQQTLQRPDKLKPGTETFQARPQFLTSTFAWLCREANKAKGEAHELASKRK